MTVDPLRIVVLGGSGFVGRHVVARLAADGHTAVVPTRRREEAKHLLLLPTVEVVETYVFDKVNLERVLAGADAVVNLVGILHESGRDTFARAHVEFARLVTAACAATGVRRLVQMSALHAGATAGSLYLRSKGEAEAIVKASELQWTIFRPSVIFGPEDSFLNLFARLARRLPVVVLASPGARFQPVYVGDVAACITQAVGDERTRERSYDLCGPRIYTLEELVRFACETSGSLPPIIRLGPRMSRWQAAVLEHLPGKLLTRDNLASMATDNVCDCPFPEVFALAPSSLEAIVPDYLSPAAMHSRFDAYRGGR